MPDNLSIMELWYAALHEEFGIVVKSSNTQLLVQKLYAARRKAEDQRLDGLSIRQSPFNAAELWILKNGKTQD